MHWTVTCNDNNTSASPSVSISHLVRENLQRPKLPVGCKVKRRKSKRIIGHIDRLDELGITGWASDGVVGLPHVSVKVAGKPINIAVERRERPDVAATHGPTALNSGFYISIKDIYPADPLQLQEFLSDLQVRADGRIIRPSTHAVVPSALRRQGIFARFKALGRVTSKRKNPRDIPKAEYEKYFLEPASLAREHGRDLTLVWDRIPMIRPQDILVFVTVRNEKPRIPYFLEYYRGLGVGHFLFVDNDSSDGLTEYLADQPDCSMWHTTASYKAANFGVHWMNHLLHSFGVGHWCLTLDPDEFLVFPYCEDRNLQELTEFLQSESQDHLFCVLLDMYPEGRVNEAIYKSGQNPIEIAAYFDTTGYVQRENASYGETFIQGGPRRRVFFQETPEKAPAINKTPLVLWKDDYNYLSSTHMMAPKAVNQPHEAEDLSVTGCLLHFKFLSLLVDKVEEEMLRKEHYDNSVEYQKYHAVLSEDRDVLLYDKSLRYRDSRQLHEYGFMSPGPWF